LAYLEWLFDDTLRLSGSGYGKDWVLSRVCSFAWREDQREFIRQMDEWKENPFPFKLYHGTLSLNKKGMMAPVLMVK
jgi:hypothetical protein